MRGARGSRRAELWGFALAALGLGAFVAATVAVWTGFGFTRVVNDRAGHGRLIETLALVAWAGLVLLVAGVALCTIAVLAARRARRRAGESVVDSSPGRW